MEINFAVGQRLAKVRKRQKISQEELGLRMKGGMSRANVSNLESGKYNFNIVVLERMAIALGVNILELVPSTEGNEMDWEEIVRDAYDRGYADAYSRMKDALREIKPRNDIPLQGDGHDGSYEETKRN